MKSTLQIGGAALIWSVTLAFAVQPRPPDCVRPIWSAEVLAELGRAGSHVPRFPDAKRAGLVFSNDGHLLVYEVGHEVDQPSSHATGEMLRPFLLRLLLLDSASGKVALRKEERTRVQSATVFVTAGGLLVKTGGLIKLYSPDLTQDHDVPFPLDRNSGVRVSVSATGKTIMLNDVIQDSLQQFHSHLDVLDASILKVRFSWNQSPPLYHHYSISDWGIAAVDFDNHSIVVSEFGSNKWTKVGEASGRCASMNMPTLYSDQQLAYGCDKLIATSIDGHALLSKPYPNRDIPSGKTVVAQSGLFIALSLDTEEIKKHLLTESTVRIRATHIAVYDLVLKKLAFTVDLNPLPKNDYDFALSPDGSKLAILNDRKVSVYSVPVQSADPHPTCARDTP